jgi:hypothetical protein
MSFRLILLFLGVCLLSGCSRTHTIDTDFPTPLIRAIERSGYLLLSEDFSAYHFVQDEDDRTDMTVILGPAQSSMFSSVATALFSEMTLSSAEADITLIPELDSFQYALPKETGSTFYEVWLKYRLQALDSGGNEIADWLITGYGRATDERLQTQGAGVNEATVEALRDIGTQLTLGFSQQADIREWLEARSI